MIYRSTKAIIDTAAFRKNIANVRSLCLPQTEMMAMVKANAYGHGIIECSRIALEEGVEYLGVAFVSEAIQLREANISAPIVLMTPPEFEELDAIVEHSIETVICSKESLNILSEKALQHNATVNVHVYIDTGMHRDGIMPNEVVEFIKELHTCKGIHWKGICTHLATADTDDTSFMNYQEQVFEECLLNLVSAGFSLPIIHSCNSAGLIRMPHNLQTLVRPGLSLYGYSPVQSMLPELQPILRLESRIVSIRQIAKGESVSYGRSFIADKDTSIATIPIGYGDGLFRGFTNSLHCIIDGKFFPVVGNICMDECMVDIGNDSFPIGQTVIFIGKDGSAEQTALDLAEILHTIPYEITTAISARVPRIFV